MAGGGGGGGGGWGGVEGRGSDFTHPKQLFTFLTADLEGVQGVCLNPLWTQIISVSWGISRDFFSGGKCLTVVLNSPYVFSILSII